MMITPTRLGSKIGHEDASGPLQAVYVGLACPCPWFDAAGL